MDLAHHCFQSPALAPALALALAQPRWPLTEVTVERVIIPVRLLKLIRAMCHHGRGDHPCPRCDAAPLSSTLLQHLLDCHSTEIFLDHNITQESLMQQIEDLHLNSLCNFTVCVSVVLTLGDIDELLSRYKQAVCH